MNGPASLNRIELYSTHDFQAEGYYCDFEMLVCSTGVQSLTSSFEGNYDGNAPSSVLSTDTLGIDWVSTTPGWNGFDFDVPFLYDGTGNLIFEFRYMGSSGTTVNVRAMALPSGSRCLDGGYPSCPVGDPMVFLTCLRVHYTTTGISPSGQGGGVLLSPRVNPFCGIAILELSQPEGGTVSMQVLDIAGRTVSSPLNGERLQAGSHVISADLSAVPSGIYAVLLESTHGRACCTVVKL